jgi:hypothetical protein
VEQGLDCKRLGFRGLQISHARTPNLDLDVGVLDIPTGYYNGSSSAGDNHDLIEAERVETKVSNVCVARSNQRGPDIFRQ